MTMMMRLVDSDGTRLAVHEYGDASLPTILAVHGYPDTSAVWDGVVRELEQRYHVVTYDVRGAGESDRPKQRAAYRLQQLARDLRAVADAVSPERPIHVLAHDWGSIQSWEAVTDEGAEQRIASYTSVSGPCLDHVAYWFRARMTPRPRALMQVLRQATKSWYIGLFQLPFLAPFAWQHGLADGFGPGLERIEGVKPTESHPAATLARDGAIGVQLYRANIGQRLRHPGERRTVVPVQVVVPVNDRYVSPALSEDVSRWTDQLWVRPVQSGHWLPLKAPAALATAVADLVDHVEGGPESSALRRCRVGGQARAEFADRLVVVTGAGSGIGRETALAFATLGADVVVADLNESAAEETVDLVRALVAEAFPYVLDVSDVSAMTGFAEWVETTHGVPDVVVNNAGIGVAGPMLETSPEDWQRIVDVNLLGVAHGCRLFGAAMVEHREGGHIVNVASAAAFTPSRTLSAYSATKAAVLMMSECLRAELADEGVGVSAICPGIVNTNITNATRYVGLSEDEQQRRRLRVNASYAKRNYPPSKVAAAIVGAVRTNAAVVPVTPEAVGAWWLSRVSPAAMRRLAKLRVFE